MARYSASGSQTLQSSGSGDATALSFAAQSTAHRNIVYELWFGNEGTPADQVTVYHIICCWCDYLARWRDSHTSNR